MSPVLNCIPSSPPSDQEVFVKAGSVASDVSNRSPPEIVSSRPNGDCTELENSCCDEVKTETEDSKHFSPTINNNNNNNIPLNYKKSPSPNGPNSEGIAFEPPIRPWNSSPNFRHDRDESVSPSSSSHRPSSCQRYSVSPDLSSETSRIPSQASSEAAQEAVLSSDSFRSKMCGEVPYDVPFPFHDSRLSSTGSFRISNSFMSDPMNPYFRLSGHPLNPFPPSPEFLGGNPFLGPGDPKLILNNPGLGLITQQLHHLNGLSTNFAKIPPGDLHRMSVQQLQFLQNHLQNLPNILQQQQQQHPPPPLPFRKFPDPKSQLSVLMQARKHSKSEETNGENFKKESFGTVGTKSENGGKPKDRKMKFVDGLAKAKKAPINEGMEVDNSEINHSDSDEVLSVGSVSPPPNCQTRMEADKTTESKTNVSNGTSSKNSNRALNGTEPNKYVNGNSPVRLPDNVTNTKTGNASNRTLKFSIDNILKSDFGNEDVIKEPRLIESKKQKESDRTLPGKTKPEAEKEKPVDLSQENSNGGGGGGGGAGGEAPMLWPAWVYCTRYSDRPSSGPRTRRSKNKEKNPEEKRPRTAFSGDQLSRLKHEFAENRYLTERRRQDLARELGLNEAQIKIWFQNKRAKMKKARGEKNPLALQLMAQGLYNHSTIPLTKEEEEAAAAELSD